MDEPNSERDTREKKPLLLYVVWLFSIIKRIDRVKGNIWLILSPLHVLRVLDVKGESSAV